MKKLKSKRATEKRPNGLSIPRPWRRTEQGGRIYLRWKLFAIYVAILTLFSWTGTTIGLYLFVKYRAGYADVSYSQIAGLPVTLNRYRMERGQYWVKQGKDAAKAGQWREAFDLLRGGLPDVPEDQEARLLLARIFVMAGRPDQVRQVLIEGLSYNKAQTDYLRTVLGFLFGQQADDAVIELTNDLLIRKDLPAEAARLARIARVYAYFNRDQFEKAIMAITEDGLAKSPEGNFIQSRIAWEKGNRESALIMLKDLHRKYPQDIEIYRTLIRYLRDKQRLDEARRIALSQQLAFSENPEAYIDYISLSADSGDISKQRTSELNFIKQFSSKPAALLKLAAVASKRGDSELAWSLVGLMDKQTEEASSATLFALDAELNSGAYKSVYDRITASLIKDKNWANESQRITAMGLQAVALLGLHLSSDAQTPLKKVLESAIMPPNALIGLATYAENMGYAHIARNLLNRAIQLDPLSQPALVALLQLVSKQRNIDEILPLAQRLPAMRKPPPDLMAEIADGLESDRYLFLAERRPVIDAMRNKLQTLAALSQSGT